MSRSRNFVTLVTSGGSEGFIRHSVSTQWRLRRGALLGAIAAAHALLGAWVLWWTTDQPKLSDIPTIVAVDVSQEQEPDLPAPTSKVPPVAQERSVMLLPLESTLALAPSAVGNGDGTGCAVATAIGAALADDEDAMSELAALPAGLRTDADAVRLWNGAWLDAAAVEPGGQSLAAQIPELRRAVTTAVLALPEQCRNVEVRGPQLIPITETGRTTMVVIGSGQWRWSNLLETPLPEAQDQSLSDWWTSWGRSGN